MRFSQIMLERMSPRVKVPDPIAAYFRWIDENDLSRPYTSGQRYALIDPALENSGLGLVPPDPDHASAWVGSDAPEVVERLVPFCRTGSDGSYAAFWVDDAGATQIVHLGSGSGSTMIGIMVDDPVDFLRLLAIGYDEVAFRENYTFTPEELFEVEYPAADYEGFEDERPALPQAPVALQRWLMSEYGVTTPQRACDIIGDRPDMSDGQSDDPFCLWLKTTDGVWRE